MTHHASEAALKVRIGQTAPIPLAAEFELASGELLALVGPSGSGKTTLLRTIAGLARPQSGVIVSQQQVWFDSERGICLTPQRRRVGLVFQDYALFPHLNALANIALAMSELPAAERLGKARELLELVNLAGLEDRRPDQLSGGQRQRVALARALARRPHVLLLDEPFSAVDQMTRERLKRELASLRVALNIPIILVTHDLEEALALADRISVLHHGRTLQTGTPEDVRLRPRTATVARLLGQINILRGTVERVSSGEGPGIVRWAGRPIEVAQTGAWTAGSRVAFMVAMDHIVLHRRGRPSLGERENPVAGTIAGMAVLGEQTALSVALSDDPGAMLNFKLPTHSARRNQLQQGADVTLSLLADGIHLMPPED